MSRYPPIYVLNLELRVNKMGQRKLLKEFFNFMTGVTVSYWRESNGRILKRTCIDSTHGCSEFYISQITYEKEIKEEEEI